MYLRVICWSRSSRRACWSPFVVLHRCRRWWSPGRPAGGSIARRRRSDGPAPPGNPIALLPALGFLAFVAIAAVAARWAQGRFGEQGIAVLLFLITGTMDVDAAIVTAGGLPPQAIGADLAAIAHRPGR